MVGDLGGGSLELIEVGNRTTGRGISLPLGVLRAEATKSGEQKAREMLRRGLKDAGLDKAGRGKCFYMVGGSWRALAKMDMIATDFPLPATHHYRMKPERAKELRRLAEDRRPVRNGHFRRSPGERAGRGNAVEADRRGA